VHASMTGTCPRKESDVSGVHIWGHVTSKKHRS
jgi:hypothetical protein